MAQTQNATQISDIHTVTVPVSDQDRALAFYVDQLGFEKRMDVSYGQGQRWIEVAPAGSAAFPTWSCQPASFPKARRPH